jgi:hypothetical protein
VVGQKGGKVKITAGLIVFFLAWWSVLATLRAAARVSREARAWRRDLACARAGGRPADDAHPSSMLTARDGICGVLRRM